MTETLTLKEAAARYRLKVATLRHEARNGRLAVYKMGKAFYTTPADIAAMVEASGGHPKTPMKSSIVRWNA